MTLFDQCNVTIRPNKIGGQHAGVGPRIISVYNEQYGILIEMPVDVVRSQHKTYELIMSLMDLAVTEINT